MYSDKQLEYLTTTEKGRQELKRDISFMDESQFVKFITTPGVKEAFNEAMLNDEN